MSEEEKDLNFPWVEEFRPTKPEDVIGAEHLTDKVNEYLKAKSFPNLLLAGDAGTGKTTIAKILAHTVSGKQNTLYINASDRNNIDTIRTDVVNFCATVGFEQTIKTIILDECDGLLPQSQKALRSVMEEYTASTRFILTCNYINKIIEPIKSRCTKFDFLWRQKRRYC
jgi:replication factor C small subunit